MTRLTIFHEGRRGWRLLVRKGNTAANIDLGSRDLDDLPEAIERAEAYAPGAGIEWNVRETANGLVATAEVAA